jgi:hypothetical protein
MKADGTFKKHGTRKARTGSTARRPVHDERAGPRPAALPPLRGNNNGPTSSRTHSSGAVIETMRRAHLGVIGAAAAPSPRAPVALSPPGARVPIRASFSIKHTR